MSIGEACALAAGHVVFTVVCGSLFNMRIPADWRPFARAGEPGGAHWTRVCRSRRYPGCMGGEKTRRPAPAGRAVAEDALDGPHRYPARDGSLHQDDVHVPERVASDAGDNGHGRQHKQKSHCGRGAG